MKNLEYKKMVIKMYEEALKEKDPLLKKVRLSFCLVLIEDKKLFEELAKK